MAPVPTTATATDANLERKKILEEISLLVQKRDTIRRETEGWQEARNAVRGELEARTGLVLSTGEYDAKLSVELRKRRHELSENINELEGLKDFKRNQVASLDRTVMEQRRDIEKKEDRKATLQEEIRVHAEGFKKAHAENTKVIEEISLQGQKVARELGKSRIELMKTEKIVTEKKAWVMAEERRLGLKGRDLAIYEDRIRKAAAAVNMEIII